MKRDVSPLRLGFTFAGCFLGAGYVSGRELWQFFGRFGGWGWVGLVLAMAALALLGIVTLLLAQKSGETALDKLIIPWNKPALRLAVTGFSLLFLFGIDAIMTAGVGALFEQLFGWPPSWVALAFSLVIAVFTLTGLEGMVAAFSAVVPFLTGAAVVLSLLCLALLPPESSGAAPEQGGWLFSAAAFASYNMFGSVAILAPLGGRCTARTVRRGVLIGTVLLSLIAALLLLVLGRLPSSAALELPMLDAVSRLHPAAAYLFSLLLLLAMFGTAFSCFLTGVDQLCLQLPRLLPHRSAAVFLLSALVWASSLVGFGGLIDTVYPAFGVCGAVFLVLLIVHYARRKNAA